MDWLPVDKWGLSAFFLVLGVAFFGWAAAAMGWPYVFGMWWPEAFGLWFL